MYTQHCVLGYSQPSLRDWSRDTLIADLFSASAVQIGRSKKANFDKYDSQPSPFDKLRASSTRLKLERAGLTQTLKAILIKSWALICRAKTKLSMRPFHWARTWPLSV
jgi:hypothetical protein